MKLLISLSEIPLFRLNLTGVSAHTFPSVVSRNGLRYDTVIDKYFGREHRALYKNSYLGNTKTNNGRSVKYYSGGAIKFQATNLSKFTLNDKSPPNERPKRSINQDKQETSHLDKAYSLYTEQSLNIKVNESSTMFSSHSSNMSVRSLAIDNVTDDSNFAVLGEVSATLPYIDRATPALVTAYKGVSAIIPCFVNNLGQRSVSNRTSFLCIDVINLANYPNNLGIYKLT